MALSLEPQHINQHTWYYEDKKGIELIMEMRDNDGRILRIDKAIIPWEKIRESLARKDAKK